MRTNIVINEKLMKQAKNLSGIDTKKEVIEEALKLFVRIKKQQGIRKFKGKLKWEGDLDAMRRDS